MAAPADDKAAKVAGIVASCEDPEGTCVETYLSARGITARPLPPCIRYRPNAYSRYAALVALSTDAAGAVHAVQQIYLNSDGRKAPVKVQKRTNKARDDWSDIAAVRLPGTPPIVLTEGVETALSVWQATGYETWACLGISNIARAPVPDGVSIVVARDGDEAGSKADKQIRQATTILRGQGRQVTVAEPPPGKDFNDVLVEQGEDAVRAPYRRRSAPICTPPHGAPDCSTTTRASPGRSSPTPSTRCAMRRSGTASSGTTNSRPRRSRGSRRPGPLALQTGRTSPGQIATTTWSPSGCSGRASWTRLCCRTGGRDDRP